MKKYLSLMSIPALMTLNSCMQEDIVKGNGEEVTANITLNLPGNGVQSRAVDNAPTAPTDPMRLFISIFDGDKLIETIEEASVSLTGEDPYNKPIRLLTGKTYKVVVWADYGDTYYNYDDETATVSLQNYEVEGNQVKNDAYFIAKDITLTASENIDLTLTRPFGLVQVTTTDWNAAVVQANKPDSYSTTISVPTELNLFDGTVDNVLDVTYTGKITNAETAEKNKLSFDYILAGAEQSPLTSFTMDYNNAEGGDVSEYTFDNIPVKRNYITNITGNVFTKVGSLDISVNQAWNDTDLSAEIVDVAQDKLGEALADFNGLTYKEINLIGDITGEPTSFELGAMSENGTIVINMNDVTGNVTFKDDDQNFSGTIKFTNKSTNAVNMTVTVPKGDAILGSGKWGAINSTTRANTLKIEDGVEVGTITVAGGNVTVNEGAIVETINKDANNTENTIVTVVAGATVKNIDEKITTIKTSEKSGIFNASSNMYFNSIRDAVITAVKGDVIELAEGTYDLGEPGQIDAAGPYGYYLNIKTPITLEGKGNVIITTTHEAAENIGGVGSLQNLINVNASDVTFKNITFKANYNNYYKGANKIILVQEPNFTIENCTITPNDKVTDCSAAIYFALNATNGSVKNCTINNGCISFDGLMDANFNIIGNKFVEGTDNLAFTTPNWTSNDVTTSKLYVNIENNTFEGFEAYEDGKTNPAIRTYYGILNLKNNKFPSEGVYWKSTKFGSIFVNYNSMISQTWSKDRTEPVSFAISNDVIEFETKTEPDNNWYAWHGRKAAVSMTERAVWEVTSTLTLTGENRAVNKSMWLNIGIDWPIVLFKQENGVRTWRYWDSNGDGQWLDVPSDKNVPTTAGNYEIKIKFNNGVITEYINDIEIASYEVSEKTSAVKEIIFNSYSIGESYKTTWTYPVVR